MKALTWRSQLAGEVSRRISCGQLRVSRYLPGQAEPSLLELYYIAVPLLLSLELATLALGGLELGRLGAELTSVLSAGSLDASLRGGFQIPKLDPMLIAAVMASVTTNLVS